MTYDKKRLYEVTEIATNDLNNVFDDNYYPIPEARRFDMEHRLIGIDVQGLPDAILLLRYPFGTEIAKILTDDVFDTTYFTDCEASSEIDQLNGSYNIYIGLLASKSELQFEIWDVKPMSV